MLLLSSLLINAASCPLYQPNLQRYLAKPKANKTSDLPAALCLSPGRIDESSLTRVHLDRLGAKPLRTGMAHGTNINI